MVAAESGAQRPEFPGPPSESMQPAVCRPERISTMRSRQALTAGALLTALMAGTASASEVRGTQVAERTTKVTSAIAWAPSLEAALEQAKKEKKLVFWLQLVGELNGGL